MINWKWTIPWMVKALYSNRENEVILLVVIYKLISCYHTHNNDNNHNNSTVFILRPRTLRTHWMEMVQFLLINCIPFQLIVVLLSVCFSFCQMYVWTLCSFLLSFFIHSKVQNKKNRWDKHKTIIINCLVNKRGRTSMIGYIYIFWFGFTWFWIKFNSCSKLWPSN